MSQILPTSLGLLFFASGVLMFISTLLNIRRKSPYWSQLTASVGSLVIGSMFLFVVQPIGSLDGDQIWLSALGASFLSVMVSAIFYIYASITEPAYSPLLGSLEE